MSFHFLGVRCEKRQFSCLFGRSMMKSLKECLVELFHYSCLVKPWHADLHFHYQSILYFITYYIHKIFYCRATILEGNNINIQYLKKAENHD